MFSSFIRKSLAPFLIMSVLITSVGSKCVSLENITYQTFIYFTHGFLTSTSEQKQNWYLWYPCSLNF